MAKVERVQVLLDPAQRQRLRAIARRRGVGVSAVTRAAVSIGLQNLEESDEFDLRERALREARELRLSMPVLEVDVVRDIGRMREDRHVGPGSA